MLRFISNPFIMGLMKIQILNRIDALDKNEEYGLGNVAPTNIGKE